MLTVQFICVGKLKESFYLQAVQEYAKRLGAYCRLLIDEIPETRLSSSPSEAEIVAALSKEADQIRKCIPRGGVVIASCIEGKALSSPEFSSLLERYEIAGVSHVTLLIGGSFGLDEALKAASDFRLSMSPMTFPHHLARVMLLEQLYRAFQIRTGGRYHK